MGRRGSASQCEVSRSANVSNANNVRNVTSTGSNDNNNANNGNYFAPAFCRKLTQGPMLVTERGKPVLELAVKRNAHPAEEWQRKAAENCTEAQLAVCGLVPMLEGEQRAHRRVGYKNSVARFHMLTMSKCAAISNSFLAGTHKTGHGQKFPIYEPKFRIVTSTKYNDRVPQASFMMHYFYPNVVPHLIPLNCACIKGRGVDMAREAFKSILRNAKQTDWCLKVDMKDYFGSIIHEKLWRELGEYITDPWAMSYFQDATSVNGTEVGLDLGSEINQLSATSFPNKLDHLLNKGTYVRYQDDFVWVGTREACKQALSLVRQEAKRLGLTVSEKKTYMQPIIRPIRFLGFSFLRKPTGRVTMKRLPEKIRHEKRKLRRMAAKGVPADRLKAHYQSARECIRKGSRSQVCNMDKFAKSLFGEG